MTAPHCWTRLHPHNWRNVATQEQHIFARQGDKRPYQVETDVLRKCLNCEKVKVKTLKGSWELEDLT